jgi:hypothetical protein
LKVPREPYDEDESILSNAVPFVTIARPETAPAGDDLDVGCNPTPWIQRFSSFSRSSRDGWKPRFS